MAKCKIEFIEVFNKSEVFIRCKIKLEILQAIYGDDATVEEISKKNKEIRKGGKT